MNKKIIILLLTLLAGAAIGVGIVLKRDVSQAVGGVTVNRPPDAVKIKEVVSPTWNRNSLSSVIGKAYTIDKINKNDERPVHVEFSYNPAELSRGVLESDIRLFKWHDEGKYWSPVKSEVDLKRHVVLADLVSFSILAIRAPVASYLTPGEIQTITAKLKKMQEKFPQYTCGVLILVDEELVAADFNFSRGDVEAHDCRNTESIKTDDALFHFNREQNGKSFTYVIHALVEWHTDPDKSIVLEGTVKDKKGRPVEGAEIIATKIKYDRLTERTTTDRSGSYNVRLHAGHYSIKVNKEKPRCVSEKWDGDLCLWGLLEGPAVRQDKWNMDFAIDCPEYVIDENQTITSEKNIMGLVSRDVSDITVSGYQQAKMKDGFGWEGAWKMTLHTKSHSGLTNRSITVGGQTVTIPNIATKNDFTYEFDFSIPINPAVGSILILPGKPIAKGESKLKFEAGPVTSSGFTYHKEEYVDEKIDLMPISLNGRFVEVGENGATIECDPLPTQQKGLSFRIKKQDEI